MGLFSSRKTDTNDTVTAVIAPASVTGIDGGAVEKSVVNVLRSRFYGRKGKQKEEPITYIPQNTSVAQTLAIGSPTSIRVPAASGSLANCPEEGRRSINLTLKRGKRTTSSDKTSSSLTSSRNNGHLLPPTPSSSRQPSDSAFVRSRDSKAMPPLPSTPVRERAGDGRGRVWSSNPSTSTLTPSKTGADTVTITLAERLNELAVANANGLLGEDEYRMLRQNLFERFSSVSSIPSESPIVPAVLPRLQPVGIKHNTPEKTTQRRSSNFQVELPQSPSPSSSRYSMASIFRRASNTQDRTDSVSVWSQKSTSSGRWKIGRILSRKSSNASIQTAVSRMEPAEATSMISRRDRGTSLSRPGTPHAPRRKTVAPPSSFPGALKQPEKRNLNSSLYNVFDEERLSTTADIREEIVAIEAEMKRLMDAFTGLEITALSEAQRSRGYSMTRSDTGRPSNAGSAMESKQIKRPNLTGDTDAGSIRSATSTGTGLTKSVHSARIGLRAKMSVTNSLMTQSESSRPSSLRRKDSSSSVRSHGVGKGSTKAAIPALPNHAIGLGQINASNVSLAKSGHHVMASVPEDAVDVDMQSIAIMRMDDELEEDDGIEDIWRKREEVQTRYEARLDYLRAKLKSAQLHEKLLRK